MNGEQKEALVVRTWGLGTVISVTLPLMFSTLRGMQENPVASTIRTKSASRRLHFVASRASPKLDFRLLTNASYQTAGMVGLRFLRGLLLLSRQIREDTDLLCPSFPRSDKGRQRDDQDDTREDEDEDGGTIGQTRLL